MTEHQRKETFNPPGIPLHRKITMTQKVSCAEVTINERLAQRQMLPAVFVSSICTKKLNAGENKTIHLKLFASYNI